MNGKYYVPPLGNSDDFKQLFNRIVAKGAGRPVDKHGFSPGPWTPDLLAEAITQIDTTGSGIDLRTVQLWFQDNDRGISTENLRWLARIFGCDDPDATSEWQAELSAARGRLVAKRKKKKLGREVHPITNGPVDENNSNSVVADALTTLGSKSGRYVDLSTTTETLFGNQNAMALPLIVFVGACALALIAFTLNIHSIVAVSESGSPKQVGFLWAPNWTITFLFVLPLYLSLVMELLRLWKDVWRPELSELRPPPRLNPSWDKRLATSSYLFWAVFFVTVVVASGYNWIATHLIPLLKNDPGLLAMDWGRVAITRPDLVSKSGAVVFSGLVFLFNGFTAYLFFAGQIFLHLIKHDFLDFVNRLGTNYGKERIDEIDSIGFTIVHGIFRCTSLGVVITILMKLQSSFLQSDSFTIVEWLVADIQSLAGTQDAVAGDTLSLGAAPGFYYSFFCLLAIAGTFWSASIRIRRLIARKRPRNGRNPYAMPQFLMDGTMALLMLSYFSIGVLPGFASLLLCVLALASFLIIKPAFAWHRGHTDGSS